MPGSCQPASASFRAALVVRKSWAVGESGFRLKAEGWKAVPVSTESVLDSSDGVGCFVSGKLACFPGAIMGQLFFELSGKAFAWLPYAEVTSCHFPTSWFWRGPITTEANISSRLF